MKLTAALIDEYIEREYTDKGKSHETIRAARADLLAFMEWLEDRDLTQPALTEYARHLETNPAIVERTRTATKRTTTRRPLSVKTRARALSFINTFCKRQGLDIAARTPTADTERKADISPLSEKHLIALCKTAGKIGEIRTAAIMLTLAGTGLRYSELKYVTTDALKKGRIEIIHGKGNKSRRVPISKSVKAVLKWYVDRADIAAGMIFATRGGKIIDLAYLSKALHKIAGTAKGGIKQEAIHAHAFRHFFATQFMKAGGEPFMLIKLLGHSNGGVTPLYVSHTDEDKRAAIEKIAVIAAAFKALKEAIPAAE